MAISKVVDRQGNAVIDLTNDTVSPETVAEGRVFHDKYGNVQIGTGNAIEDENSDWDIHNNFYFIDYDGELLYKYSMTELQNLTELPTPTVEHENLTFDEWNWTLEDLKNESAGIIVGANYHTTDGKDHMKMKVIKDNSSVTVPVYTLTGTENVTIDWGDGTSDTWTANTAGGYSTHTYATAGVYDVVITNQNDNMTFLYVGSSGASYNQYVYPIEINLHTNAILGSIYRYNNNSYYGDTVKMSIPAVINTASIKSNTFYNFFKLLTLVLPRTVTDINFSSFIRYCHMLKFLSIPKLSATSVSGSNFLSSCYSLKYLTIPDGVESVTISDYCTSLRDIRFPSTLKTWGGGSCLYLKKIIIPEGTTSLTKLDAQCAEYVIIPTGCSHSSTTFSRAKYLDIGSANSAIYFYGYAEVIINKTNYDINNGTNWGIVKAKYYRGDYKFGRVVADTVDFSNWKGTSAPTLEEYSASSCGEFLVPADKYEQWRTSSNYWKMADTMGKIRVV